MTEKKETRKLNRLVMKSIITADLLTDFTKDLLAQTKLNDKINRKDFKYIFLKCYLRYIWYNL